ncbi:hypothetical protein ISX56_34665, partial [Serratia ureilytica]|nr:hypothetical protein [Serratia ureilytica]
RTLLLWVAFFCSLFVFYLLTSWLPTLLKDAGYDIARAPNGSNNNNFHSY